MTMGSFSLYSAGSNAHGQLANDSEVDSHCFNRCVFHGMDEGQSIGSKILSIAAGANHTLLLLRSHDGSTQLWGCGDGRRGQLGAHYLREYGASSIFRRISLHQDEPQYSESNVTLVAASWETSFLVISRPENDILLSVGSNDFGDLGVDGLSRGRKETSTWQVVGFKHLLPKKASSVRISGLKAGPHNVLVKILYQDSNMREVELVMGWGSARQGQLGFEQGSKKPQAIVDTPRILDLPSPISAFTLGNQHSLFLTSEGTVKAFGSNRKGQLAGLDTVKNICAVAATWNGTYLLQKPASADGNWTILATGSNSNGQLSRDPASDAGTVATRLHKIILPAEISPGASLMSIICGSEHVLIGSRLNGGGMDVFAWGWNEHGNLGLGHTLDVHELTRIWPVGHPLHTVVDVWAGCATSWIAVEEG